MPLTTERFVATVTKTNDPEERGRIKVCCPGIMGDDTTEMPDFIEPAYDWGWFLIPNVGEIVEIEAVVSSDQDESSLQAFLEAPDLKWRGKRFHDTEAESPVSPIHPDFKGTGYGQKRGFATPKGQILIFDDEGALIRMSWMKDPAAENTARTSLVLEEAKATLVVNEKHSIVLEEDKTTITHDGGNAVTYENNEGDATLKLGDGAVSATIAEHLQTLWDTTTKPPLDIFGTTHLHPSAMGPTGIPAPTFTLPTFDLSIISAKAKIPDN